MTRYAELTYPASWSGELDAHGRATFGAESKAWRCGVDVLRIDEPPPAAARALVHSRLSDDEAFDEDLITIEPTTWAGAPAIRARADVRTAPWPGGERVHLEAIASGRIAVATGCTNDGFEALRPGLALLEERFVLRDGPVPPVTSRHLRMPVVEGWTVNVAAGDREEPFASAPICSVRFRWMRGSPETALAEEIRRGPPAGKGTEESAVLLGLPARRWHATGGDSVVTYRAEVTTAALDGGTLILATSAAEYEPCGPRIAAVVAGVGLADRP